MLLGAYKLLLKCPLNSRGSFSLIERIRLPQERSPGHFARYLSCWYYNRCPQPQLCWLPAAFQLSKWDAVVPPVKWDQKRFLRMVFENGGLQLYVVLLSSLSSYCSIVLELVATINIRREEGCMGISKGTLIQVPLPLAGTGYRTNL